MLEFGLFLFSSTTKIAYFTLACFRQAKSDKITDHDA